MRYLSRRELGRVFTIGVIRQEGHQVIRTGLYRWVRHPGYAGFILFYLGAPLIIPGLSLAAEEPHKFTLQAGFGGDSEGNGTLKLVLGRTQTFHVVSRGTVQGDGSFRLEQRIAFAGKPSRDRVWILTTASPGHYSGTLSDASGPVTGFTSGSRLSLRYRLKGPLLMHQQLQLMPDGKIIDNVGVITVLGVPVGRLHETIERRSRAP